MMPSTLLFELSRLFVAEAKLTRSRVERERLGGISTEINGRAIAALREETKSKPKKSAAAPRRASARDRYASMRGKTKPIEVPLSLGSAWR